MSNLKILKSIMIKWLINITYYCFFMFRVNPQKITFASYRANSLSGNLKPIFDKIDHEYPQYHKVTLIKKLDNSLEGRFSYVMHMIKASYYLATSKYFLVDDYYLPIYLVRKREGVKIIQLWHAAGALKKFGHSTIGKEYGPSKSYLKHIPIHSNYSLATVSSKEVIPFYAEAFNMDPSNIKALGLPRTDILFSEKYASNIYTNFICEFPQAKNKKLILYAPTYRGKSHHQETYQSPLDFDILKEQLNTEEYILLVHLHPYMKAGSDLLESNNNFIIYISDEFNIQELLLITDILITDYSTVFIDFAIREKPILFFAQDLKEYIAERDFYYDYEKLIPGPLFQKTAEIGQYIASNQFNIGKVKQFKDRFFDYQDGKSTDRIVSYIFEENKN